MLCNFPRHRAIAVIDTEAITHNYKVLHRHAEAHSRNVRPIAVVKANAYGHGLELVVPTLLRAGCDFFAVATLEEAMEVRALTPRADVLVLGYTPPEAAPTLAELRLTQTVFSTEYAKALSAHAKNDPVSVHIKLDGGMHRLGFHPDDPAAVDAAAALPLLRTVGLYTHFPSADTDLAATRYAFSRFLRCREHLSHSSALFCHAAASAALLTLPETVLHGIRPGLALYGVSPVPCTLPLRPAMRLQAPVVQLQALPAGTPVGYGGAFVTKRPTIVGTCPIGYGDGLPRAAEGFAVTLIHQTMSFSVPVIGHVCMDQTMVDLTDTPAAVGDQILFFEDPRPLAAHAHTIPYEILTAISHRAQRKRKEASP